MGQLHMRRLSGDLCVVTLSDPNVAMKECESAVAYG